MENKWISLIKILLVVYLLVLFRFKGLILYIILYDIFIYIIEKIFKYEFIPFADSIYG